MALPRSHRSLRRAVGMVVGAIVLASLTTSLAPDVASATSTTPTAGKKAPTATTPTTPTTVKRAPTTTTPAKRTPAATSTKANPGTAAPSIKPTASNKVGASSSAASGAASDTATGTAKTAGLSAAALRRLPADVRSSAARLALIATFKAEADRYGVPADLLMSVAYTESGWRSSVVSADGAIGICQLLPATARWLARDLIGLPGLSARDPEDNIRMGARFLRQLLRSLRTERLALAAYFDGHGTVTRTGVSTVAARYVRLVQKRRSMFKGL